MCTASWFHVRTELAVNLCNAHAGSILCAVKLPTRKSGQVRPDAAASRRLRSVQAPATAQTVMHDDEGGARVNSETSKQMTTAVRFTLPPSSRSGDGIASNRTPSEMLQRRI